MKWLLLKLLAAVLTFTIGVGASLIWSTYLDAPDLDIPQADEILPVYQRHCFPGLAIASELKTNQYFPDQSFGNTPLSRYFKNGWYSRNLVAMNEPSMFKRDERGERYRFLWLRSFGYPIAIRVEQEGDRRFIVTKESHGAGGYDTRRLLSESRRPLSAGEWFVLEDKLEQACFWRLPSIEEEPTGEDGAQWILEGQLDGRYHVVDRWSPTSGAYREACMYLLRISGIDLSREALY